MGGEHNDRQKRAEPSAVLNGARGSASVPAGSQDSAWKEVIHNHFPQFIQFYFPQIAKALDFSRPLEFLDKELKKLFPGISGKDRYADLIVKAAARDEPSEILYIHIEVQGTKDKGFAGRLFTYAYRILERFDEFPVSLVLLTDADSSFYPSDYAIDSHGRQVRVAFQIVKLVYYRERRDELESSRNLFAEITLMQLDVLEVKERLRKSRKGRSGRLEELYAVKKRLLVPLLDRIAGKERVTTQITFLDWLVQLPDDWEAKLSNEVEAEAGGVEKMAYVTSWERRGIRIGKREGQLEGKREGQLEGKREILLRQLSRKFVLGSEEKQKILHEDNLAKLDRALDQIIIATSKDEILKELD